MRLRQLFEAKRTAVVAFGRMNPPTIGHQKLVEKLKSYDGDHYVFLSQTQKPKTDPLAFKDKLRYAKFFFPEITIGHPEVRTIMDMMVMLQNLGYTDIIYVAGSDRVGSFDKLLNNYNGQPDKEGNIGYNFNSIKVVNAGQRDPDADGVEGMSASKLKKLAAEGRLEDWEDEKGNKQPGFRSGVPRPEVADEMFDAVRKGMGIKELEPAESIEEGSLRIPTSQLRSMIIQMLQDMETQHDTAKLVKIARMLGKEVYFMKKGDQVVLQDPDFDFYSKENIDELARLYTEKTTDPNLEKAWQNYKQLKDFENQMAISRQTSDVTMSLGNSSENLARDIANLEKQYPQFAEKYAKEIALYKKGASQRQARTLANLKNTDWEDN